MIHTEQARRYAVVVAGGKGLRMGQDIPKQFIPIGGRPVLMHTLERLAQHCARIVLVLPEAHMGYWRQLCQDYDFALEHELALGGATRFDSVHSGLKQLASYGVAPADLVAVHDGVRPFVSADVVESCYAEAAVHGAALPYLPVVDSLRQYTEDGSSRAVDRASYVAVQTPQVFRLGELLEAYSVQYQVHFTDDASVWEYTGRCTPRLVLGNAENIKLTTPRDLAWAELILRQGL